MPRNFLKAIRVTLAAVTFIGLTLAFVDFRGFCPPLLGHALAQIQFVPGLVSLASGFSLSAILFGLGIVIAATVGRFYCSAICPLGVLQDIVSRVARKLRRKKSFLPYAKPFTKLRHFFLWGTVLVAVLGWSGFALALLDPYSNYGRILSMLGRPLLTATNNLIVGPANALGIQSLYRVDATWASAGMLLFPAAFTTIVILLSAMRGRLYCNSVCPVGTTLGFISRMAAFRIGIDKTKCTKCGDCLRTCKAQCIDLRSGTVDASRCVACYNCISACDEHGIKYRWGWKKTARKTTPAPQTSAHLSASDPQRRDFLLTVAGGLAASTALNALSKDEPSFIAIEPPLLVKQGADSRGICPPGAQSVAQFLDRCTACHLCISACPTHVLKPAWFEYGLEGLFRPQLKYTSAYCLFECTRCGEVCPDGAITPLDLAKKSVTQIGVADLYLARCVVQVNGTDCAACSEHCPTKAVTTKPYRENLRIPTLDQNLCIGCGACEYACPVKPKKAILVTGRSVHATAEKRIETKATAPTQNGDFPF